MDEYDKLSGGLASKVMENQLNSISAESLGLSNLSDDPQEIMEALENASKLLDEMNACSYADRFPPALSSYWDRCGRLCRSNSFPARKFSTWYIPMQNSGLEKIVQQVNAKYGGKQSRDIVELSQKALELLDASKWVYL